jgi:tyrosinase
VQRHFDGMAIVHQGPIFCPWHRVFALVELQQALFQVDAQAVLPYWRWEEDNGQNSVFTEARFGPDGDPANGFRVLTGPFKDWQMSIYDAGRQGLISRPDPGLIRQIGSNANSLPTGQDVQSLLNRYTTYDAAPWNSNVDSFRNRLEGFVPTGVDGSSTHNRVHNYVGGDLSAATSPNDPVFFLLHANVDRIWWQWQNENGINSYVGPAGSGRNERMPLQNGNFTPAQVEDAWQLGYDYA